MTNHEEKTTMEKTDRTDIYMMIFCLIMLGLALATMPPTARPHTHDGGRTWHAHVAQ